jgi:hypothetical protein
MTDASEEGRHPPGRGRLWEESYSFDFAARDGSVGGYARIGLRPAAGEAWFWAAVVGPGRPSVLVRDHDVPLPRGRSLELRTSGLWADHTCETPLEHWTIGLEAFAVALDDPLEAFRGERGDPCPLGFDLEWEASEGATALVTGYRQPCTVHGEVLVGSERLELDAVGWRAHEWGDRDWWSEDGSATWATGHFDGDHPDRAEGDRADLDDGPFAFEAGDVEVVTDDGGLVRSATIARLDLTATPLAHAPVAVPGPHGVTTRLDRVLCRYECSDGRRASGWIQRLTPPA